jgi:ribosomal protein S8
MKPDPATLRTKIEQAISGLVTSKGYLEDVEDADKAQLKRARTQLRNQVELVIEKLNDLTEAVEENEEL